MGVDSSPKSTQQNEKVSLIEQLPKSYNQQEYTTLIPLKVRTGTQGK